jgi:lipid-binding SYLF domain-containing protein
MSLVASVLGVERADLDFRLSKLTLKLEVMQSKPDKRIPPEQFRNAQGIILLDRTKAGFLFAYQGGSGAVMVRDPKSGRWSPPAFLKASEASLGFQIGGQQSFVVVLLMNTNAIQPLMQGSFKFGGEASGTAGNNSGGAEGALSSTEPLMLVYSDREGLYGGAALKGDALSPDTEADIVYYGQYLTMKEILFDQKAKPSQAATELVAKIEQFSK